MLEAVNYSPWLSRGTTRSLILGTILIVLAIQRVGSLPQRWSGSQMVPRPFRGRPVDDDVDPMKYLISAKADPDYGARESRVGDPDEIPASIPKGFDYDDALKPELTEFHNRGSRTISFPNDNDESYRDTHSLKIALNSEMLNSPRRRRQGRSDQGRSRENPEDRKSSKNGAEKRSPQDSSNNFRRRTSEPLDDTFVFPSDDPTPLPPGFDLGPVPKCQGSTFCEKTSSYPKEYISNVIQKYENLQIFAGIDNFEIAERTDPTEDAPLCPSIPSVVFPQSAKNKDNEWLTIMNQDGLQQGVEVETCINRDSECAMTDGFPLGYKTSCKQKYVYRKMAALAKNATPISDMFMLPSSCCCHVTSTGSLMPRIGSGQKSGQNTTRKFH